MTKHIHRVIPIWFENYPPILRNKRDLLNALNEGFEIVHTDRIKSSMVAGDERIVYILRKEVSNDDQ